jgi:hypothetical protein
MYDCWPQTGGEAIHKDTAIRTGQADRLANAERGIVTLPECKITTTSSALRARRAPLADPAENRPNPKVDGC